MRYKHAVMGGTFDRLHKGHISNLKTAFESGETVTVGLTTEALHKNKELAHIIQPYEVRKKQILAFAEKEFPKKRVDVHPIEDIYGPSITEPKFEALIVTKETHKNGLKINEIRKKNGLKELEIVVAPWLLANDGGMLSSTRIRQGEIDREGFVYKTIFEKTLRLPGNLRGEFKKAPGDVVRGADYELHRAAQETAKLLKKMKPTMIISVGDIVSKSIGEAGLTPDVKIIDYKSKRKDIGRADKFHVVNEPGTINSDAAAYIEATVRYVRLGSPPRTVAVEGEEDLLVPPAILSAPLESVVLHGQVDEGIVITPVTEEKKAYIRSLLEKFEI